MTIPQIPARIEFDPQDLTLGEMEDIEEASGVAFQELITQFEAQQMTTRAMRAVMWVLIRRSNPDYTLEDTRSLSVRDFDKMDVILESEEVDVDAPLDEEAAASGETE